MVTIGILEPKQEKYNYYYLVRESTIYKMNKVYTTVNCNEFLD